MFKNVAGQKLVVFAFDSTTNLPKTGDAANITAYVSKDYGTVTVLGDTSATEEDATNAKGYYLFDLTAGESNGDCLQFSAKSSTANIVVIGVPAVVFTLPASFTSFVTPPTVAAIATAIWQDLLASGDFGTASSIGKLLKDDIDAAVSSRLATSGYTVPPTVVAIATAIWQDLLASGDFGTASSIGKLIKDDLDATISSRLATSGYTVPPTVAAIATAIWQDLLAGGDFGTASSIGKLLKDDIDAAISSRSTLAAGAQMDLVNAPNGAAITAIQSGLATSASQTTILNRIGAFTGTGLNTLLGFFRALLRKDAALTPSDVGGTFDNTTDSTQAIRDEGDLAWGGGGGGGTDPLLNNVPGSYAPGTAGFILGNLNLANITVVSPIAVDGSLTLVAGDDYKAVDGRAIDFINAAGTWSDLTNATIYFTGCKTSRIPGLPPTKWPVTGSVMTPTGPNQKVRIEPTAAQTAGMRCMLGALEGYFLVTAVLADGNVETLVTGPLEIAP